MGLDVARAIQETLGLKEIPGAAQIRIGGVKGMLSLKWDWERRDCIGIRPSQVKFRSSHRVLEVKEVAKTYIGSSHKLFKEALLVMDHLGVQCSLFYKLQERACAEMVLEKDVKDALRLFTASQSDGEADESDYVKNALESGAKMNGEPFATSELEAIQEKMEAARDKVNLNLQCSVMFGIIDEYGVLEENEVLVCNGRITGEVLVLRAPCMFPGDIQKATAVARRPESIFTCLDHVIVFSSKGDRPLADTLGGGDLDGDKYFVVYERELVEMLSPALPHNFGTQNDKIPHEADISMAFCAPSEHTDLDVPAVEDQLCVLGGFLDNGNLVSLTADAWLRMADKLGVADGNVQRLAQLHQRALDSRKSYGSIDPSELVYMYDILEVVPVPHYKHRSDRQSKGFASFLDLLHRLWIHNINSINILIARRSNPSPQSSFDIDAMVNTHKQLVTVTMESMQKLDREKEKSYRYCVTCGVRKKCASMTKCAVCGFDWACPGQCEVTHWRICFGIQWREGGVWVDNEDDSSVASSSIPSSTLGSYLGSRDDSFLGSREITADTASLTTSFDETEMSVLSEETRDALDYLIDLVFGEPKPTLSAPPIEWHFLNAERDLPALKQLALKEFYTGFRNELTDARAKTSDRVDSPHIYDVFVMEPRPNRGSITLAVCLRDDGKRRGQGKSGLLMWYDGRSGEMYPMTPEPFHLFRVASLSGTCRIVESLSMRVLGGSLMDLALRRDADAFVDASTNALQLKPELYSTQLNLSQKQAVAALSDSSFSRGFFLVHGPPGTGKTVTLAAMVASIDGGLVVAPSNAAVANVAVKVLSCRQFSIFDVVVFGENCDDKVHFLSPSHRSRRFTTFQRYWKRRKQREANKLLSDFAAEFGLDLSALVKSQLSLEDKLLVGFASWLKFPHDKATTLTFETIQNHCPKIDETPQGQQALKKLLPIAKVVLCTLNTAGSGFLREAVGGKHCTLFLDEAAQCPEAEFYIATTFPGIKRIVIIGDPQQLNATVIDIDCDHVGYGDSWMKHAMDLDVNVHLLDLQYRCDGEILAFSNKQFYKNRIRSDKSVQQRKPNVQSPLKFIDTAGGGKEEREGSSFRNDFEAEGVMIHLTKDADVQAVIDSSKHASVMIITPYRAQVTLLRRKLVGQKLRNVRCNTVDAFQGQEADIVVLSLVRTEVAGFTDDAQRINVAMTRAKLVLRIFGKVDFWASLGSKSIIRKLIGHCRACDAMEYDPRVTEGRQNMKAWLKPKWGELSRCQWRVNMTSQFHHCVKELNDESLKNVPFNTLIKLASLMKSNEKDMFCLPSLDEKIPRWQMTALKGFEGIVQVVWCAKEQSKRPVIEAHYAGTKEECLRFQQLHPALPKGAACVKRASRKKEIASDYPLLLVEPADDDKGQSRTIEKTWNLDRNLGNAILDGVVSELPQKCCFELDEYQKRIILESPPLILESGSGTGKTNVLFEHAVRYAREVKIYRESKELKQWERVCFITLSKRLRDDLESRYATVSDIEVGTDAEEKVTLPIQFFSLKELLCHLLCIEVKDLHLCDFNRYVNARTSHQLMIVDAKEAENEIGGVIMGSLDAAIAGRALTREEYLRTGRSYVEGKSDKGKRRRHDIYTEYEQYTKWKRTNEKRDINDVVMGLIVKLQVARQKQAAYFQALYLDEVQDLSYATIYLISSIAGHTDSHWVFAGDTSQMISPGCSFKFSGLKDVLLAVTPGIERKIKEVVRLEKNYRVTNDVLLFSNCILKRAQKHFPADIRYFQQETAVNDLGTKVRICKWKDALALTPKFGTEQALIYSSDSSESELEQVMRKWLPKHPHILTPLDSKGLEYDDVVAAFQIDRKSWNLAAGVASLRLLRGLYVTGTRARRRVVILAKSKEMKRFFLSLEGYNIEEADAGVALLEFNKETTPQQWMQKGMQLFEEEQFKVAAGCFNAAGNLGYMNWAYGLLEEDQENRESARDCFRRSAHAFFERADYEHTLDLLVKVKGVTDGWNIEDDHIYETSINELPNYFDRSDVIQFALQRGRWNEISIDDLKSSPSFFVPHRNSAELQEIIASCPKDDLSDVETSLPILVADYYFTQADYFNAARLYLTTKPQQQDSAMAEKASNQLIGAASSHESLDDLAQHWRWSKGERASESVSKNGDTFLLLQLYEDPLSLAKGRKKEAMRKFGSAVIRSAVNRSSKTPTEALYEFSVTEFSSEVDQALRSKFGGHLIEALQFYLHRNDVVNAEKLAASNILSWSKDELLDIARAKLNPKGIVEAADERDAVVPNERDALVALTRVYLSQEAFNLQMATQASDRALASIAKAEANAEVLIQVWDEHRSDRRIKKMIERKQPNPPGPKTVVFLRLFWEPEQSSRQLSSHCMEWFGARIVENALSRMIDDAKQKYDVLSRFDGQAFEHLHPPRQAEDTAAVVFKRGDRVVTHSMPKPQENGKKGTVTRVNKKRERYGVRFDDGKEGTVLASRLRLDGNSDSSDDDSSDSDSGPPRKPPTGKKGKHGVDSKAKPTSQARYGAQESSSDSDEPPPLNDRNGSSSDESSSSGSVPQLLERRARSDSSDSSSDSSFPQADDSDSSSSSVPPLTRKDNSSSDEDDIPQLLSPNQQSSSSSDESIPGRRFPRGGVARGRGGRSGRGEGGTRGGGRQGRGTGARGAGKGRGRKKRK